MSRDCFLPLGENEEGVQGLRHRVTEDGEHEVTPGVLRNLKEGEPITGGEVVMARSTKEGPFEKTLISHKGPARVSNPKYRAGWDDVFGKKTDDKLLN